MAFDLRPVWDFEPDSAYMQVAENHSVLQAVIMMELRVLNMLFRSSRGASEPLLLLVRQFILFTSLTKAESEYKLHARHPK